MSTNGLKGYSEFFTSGFRAVVGRMRRRQSSVASVASSPAWLDSEDELPMKSLGLRNLDKKHRRSRTASLIITPSSSQSRETKHARRSSLVSTLSTRLFDRIVSSPTPSPEKSGWASSGSSRSSRSGEITDPQIADVCIAMGGPYTPMATGGSSDYVLVSRTIDPFAPSPDPTSKPYFIDMTSTPPPSSTPKGESFLSMSGSGSPDQSLTSLPLITRRERPISIQTMPLPARSRRSSFQYRRASSDKWDESSLILEEEDSPLDPDPAPNDRLRDPNDLANIDWRQFHIDLLLDA